MTFLLYTLHTLICVFLILVVLLQQGKGADLSVFGGGATMTAFGARGAATLLHKLTVGSFVLFIVTTLTIGVVASRSGDRSVVPSDPAPAAEAPAEKPALPAALPSEDEGTETPPPAAAASPEAAPPADAAPLEAAPVEAAPVDAAPAAPAPPPPAEAPASGGGR